MTADEERARPYLRSIAWLVAATLVALPIVRMTGLVLDSSPLQHADYWQLVDRFVDDGGGLDVGGLFVFNNEHPLVVPQLLLWGNIGLFHGSNVALGLVVVAIGIGQLAILALVVGRSDVTRWERMALLVLASTLVFSLLGTWNFSKAMSGAAWLTANLFALAAVLFRSRGRTVAAFVGAGLATVSYGTGIVAWPAVALVGLCRRTDRQWWREWPAGLGFIAAAVWYRSAGNAPPADPVDLGGALQQAAGLLGFVFGADGVTGDVVGGLALIATPIACTVALVGRRASAAAWAGVAGYGWAATLLISFGRHETLAFFGSNRYTSLIAITWIGLAGLVSTLTVGLDARRPATGIALAAVMALLALRAGTVGGDHADQMLGLNDQQERREIVLRLDLAEGNDFVGSFGIELPPITDLLRSLEHHPFRSWGPDCGLLGEQLPVFSDSDPSAEAGRIVSAGPLAGVDGAVAIDGVVGDDLDLRCVVLVDGSGTVVGAASLAGTPGTFQGVARADADPSRAVAVVHDDAEASEDQQFVVLDGEYRPSGTT